MADAIVGNTELTATKQAVISAIVQKELAFAAKLVPTIENVSSFAVKGAKSISIPKYTSFTVVNRTSGAQGDATQLTTAVDTMLLNFNAYVAWIIDAMDEVQSRVENQALFAQRAANAHGRYVDTQIIAELELVGDAIVSTGDITLPIFLEMREKLLSHFADINRCYFVCGLAQEAKLLAINEFVRADAYGSSNIPNGVIGTLYGIKVMIHAGITGQTYYMYESGGCAIGFQSGPNTTSQPANEFGANSVRVAMDQLFGVKGLQIGQAGVGVAESALVVKDNN